MIEIMFPFLGKANPVFPNIPFKGNGAFLFTDQLILLNGQTKIPLRVCQLLLYFPHLVYLTDLNAQVLISDEIHQDTQTDGDGKIDHFPHTEYGVNKQEVCNVAYAQTDDGIKGFEHQKTGKEKNSRHNGKIRHSAGQIHIMHIKQQMPEQNHANADHIKPISCHNRHIAAEIND